MSTCSDHQAVPDDRRARGAPLERRDVVRADVDAAEVDLPQEVPVHVVGVQALRSERRDDDPPVGCGRRARIRGFDVPLVRRLSFVRDALPQRFPGPLVDGVDRPALARAIVRRVPVAVESGTERRVRVGADGARDEDPVAPHHRTRMREAGDRRAPQDVLALWRRPRCREGACPSATPARARTAKRRPASGVRRRLRQRIRRGAAVRTILRTGIGSVSPAGRQVLRSRIMRRGVHASDTTSNVVPPVLRADTISRGLDRSRPRRPAVSELNLGAVGLPGPLERGPAGAFEREDAVRAEASRRTWRTAAGKTAAVARVAAPGPRTSRTRARREWRPRSRVC